MLRRITVEQVRIGMFIHGFDGPWHQHPFWLPRFKLSAPADLTRILDSKVTRVVIDEARGLALHEAASAATLPPAPSAPAHGAPIELPASLLAMQPARSFAQEQERCKTIVTQSTAEMKRLFALAHHGEGLQLDQFTPLIAEVMSSITRNPYALIALTRLKRRDEYTYVHSLAVSALMVSLGRRAGMFERDVFNLGLAGLLHDIGKMIVPDEILRKPDSLTDAEFALVRTHPEQGYRLLSQNAETPQIVLDVCRHHHERRDGTGYPFGLKGDAISRSAQIAAICDVYDALTSNRSYKAAWTAEQAITQMAEWSGHFDRSLLLTFMKAIGVYPPGLLVRLRSNRLGVTLPNGRRASRPAVRAFYCSRHSVQLPLEDVVIEDDLSHDQIIGEEYPLDWGFADWPRVAAQLIEGTVPRLAVRQASMG